MREPATPIGNARRAWGSRLRLVGFGLLAVVLIALIVLASRPTSIPGGDDRANAGPVIAIVHAIEIVGLAVELVALVILVVVFRLARRREDDEDQTYHEPVPMPWPLKVVLVALPLLLSAGLIAMFYRFLTTDQPLELAPPVGMPAPPERGGFVDQVTGSLGLSWWELLLAVALAAVVLVLIGRAFRLPPPAAPAEPEPPQAETILATAVRAGLRDARLEPDPRRAVIAAYATMERLLAAHGLPRRAVEAPLEYMARLFAALDVSSESLRTLTDLFERARFSQHPISPAAKERAITALTAIEQELRAP